MYEAETEGIAVSVRTAFVPDHSNPARNRWFFAYTVTIQNGGESSVKLMSRHWKIRNDRGVLSEVEGEGVVGEQPLLDPAQSYNYTSGVPLDTPSGIMGGEYTMQREDGSVFRVTIPTFSLDAPDLPRALN